MIEDRKLKVGTQLAATHKGREHRCEVVAGEEGRVRYRLADGREFKTPSGAGSAVMGGVACNGWRFWSVAAADEAVRVEGKPAKSAKTKEPRRARTLPGKSQHGKVTVARNGHKLEGTWRGRIKRR